MTRTYFGVVSCFASLMGGGGAAYLITAGTHADLPSVFVGAMLGLGVFSTFCAWTA